MLQCKSSILVVFALTWISATAAFALTDQQNKGMYRHGIWEWSIRTCPNIVRNKGYWFALKEVGGFENADHIIRSENSKSFLRGWAYMAGNAERFGVEATCKYAAEQWPAVLWTEQVSE